MDLVAALLSLLFLSVSLVLKSPHLKTKSKNINISGSLSLYLHDHQDMPCILSSVLTELGVELLIGVTTLKNIFALQTNT